MGAVRCTPVACACGEPNGVNEPHSHGPPFVACACACACACAYHAEAEAELEPHPAPQRREHAHTVPPRPDDGLLRAVHSSPSRQQLMSNGHFTVQTAVDEQRPLRCRFAHPQVFFFTLTCTRGGQFDLVYCLAYHLVYAPTPHPRPGPHHVKKSQRNQEKDKPRAAFVSLLDGNLALVKTDPRYV